MKTTFALLRICAGLGSLLSMSAGADELMKWERIPLQIPLRLAQERVVFVDKNVRVGFPQALNGKLRVQSTGGAVYLRAEAPFPATRLQLQDVETGEVILLDVTASDAGPTEPVRLVYGDGVLTLSHRADLRHSGRGGDPTCPGGGPAAEPHHRLPLPVLLTRYAAQSLYAPLRNVEGVPGIHPLNAHLPESMTTLYPSEPLVVVPVAAWGLRGQVVIALRLRNTVGRNIVLDPRVLQGNFVAATFQHRWLGAAGTPEDTTMLYLVTAGRPGQAFIAEPVRAASRKRREPAE